MSARKNSTMTMIEAQLIGSHGASIDGRVIDCTQHTSPGGTRINKSGVAPRVCRKLLEEGHDPATMIAFFRGETPCLNPRSIGWWAGVSVEENSSTSARFGAFKKRPESAISGSL